MKIRITLLELVIVAGLVALVFVVLRASNSPCKTSIENVRQARLRMLSSLIDMYATDHEGQYPQADDFESFVSWAWSSEPDPIFGDDETQDDIWMCPIPWEDRRIPLDISQEELAQIPMLHNRVDLNPDGTSVAFWDGDVRLLNNEDFEALIDVKNSICLGCQMLNKKAAP